MEKGDGTDNNLKGISRADTHTLSDHVSEDKILHLVSLLMYCEARLICLSEQQTYTIYCML